MDTTSTGKARWHKAGGAAVAKFDAQDVTNATANAHEAANFEARQARLRLKFEGEYYAVTFCQQNLMNAAAHVVERLPFVLS